MCTIRKRFTRPLRRVGERGEGRFEPVTWDEALDTVEQRFNRIKASMARRRPLRAGHRSGRRRPHLLPVLLLRQPQLGATRAGGPLLLYPALGAMMAVHGDYAVLDAGQFLPDGISDPEYKVPK